MPHRTSARVPADLRARLETARLDTLAFLRALDRAGIPVRELPAAQLHQLYELDTDCAEALWALDQSPHAVNVAAMVRDTLASLQHLPTARDAVRTRLPPHPRVQELESSIRAELDPREAYNDVPGHSPQSR